MPESENRHVKPRPTRRVASGECHTNLQYRPLRELLRAIEEEISL